MHLIQISIVSGTEQSSEFMLSQRMLEKPLLKHRLLVAVAPLTAVLVGIFVAGILKVEPRDEFASWGVATAAAIIWLSGTLIFTAKR